jgi:hypothetical protein
MRLIQDMRAGVVVALLLASGCDSDDDTTGTGGTSGRGGASGGTAGSSKGGSSGTTSGAAGVGATGAGTAGVAGSPGQGGSASGGGAQAGRAGAAGSSGRAEAGRAGGGGVSGSGGGAQAGDTGAGGEPSVDPRCPMDMPTEGDDCPPGPRVSCTYDETSCFCTTFWDCTGCPPGGPAPQADCTGYEGMSCGSCDCPGESYPTWYCGPQPGN